MKAWLVAIAAAVAGIIAGVATAGLEVTWRSTEFDAFAAAAARGEDTRREQPLVEVVNGEEFDFGTMELNSTRSHEFVVKNVGAAPLTIEQGSTTCKCTISDLPQDELPPGGQVTVRLEWKATTEGEFRQTAELATNDPLNPTLSLAIHGYVAQSYHLTPDVLNVGRISANAPVTARVRLESLDENIQVVEHTFLDEDSADYFELQVQPLAASQLKGMSFWAPRSGVMLEITIKPGLPLGAINQTIRLTTGDEEVPQLEVPIEGRVISDLTLLGDRRFDEQRNLLNLGTVKREAGTSAQLHVLVKGPQRQEIELRVEQVQPPEALSAQLGEPADNGAVLVYPLTISVPADAPAVNRLGRPFGKVTIKTTHPQVEQLELLVRFAVEVR